MNDSTRPHQNPLSFEEWQAAVTAQQLVKSANALEARLSGLVKDAPLHTIQETATIAQTLAAQISEQLLVIVRQVERVLATAERDHSASTDRR